jgi:hypothetical protein
MAVDLFDPDNLKRIFTTQGPKSQATTDRLDALTGQFIIMATTLANECPPSADRTLALRKLEESCMWAKKSVMMNQDEPADAGG